MSFPNRGNSGSFTVSPCPNIVRPYGYSKIECGYCKGSRCSVVQAYCRDTDTDGTGTAIDGTTRPTTTTDTTKPDECSKSYSVLVDSMSPAVYEQFMYRGWRRSGTHLYKPCNFESCCPTLTIRLPVQDYQPTKSQAQIPNKLDRRLQKTRKSTRTTTTTEAEATKAADEKPQPTIQSVKTSSPNMKPPSTKHKQQQQSSSAAAPSSSSSSSSSSMEYAQTLIQQCGMLQKLQTSTHQALVEIFTANDQLSSHTNVIPTSPKFKFLAPSKKKQKQWNQTRTSSLSSSSAPSSLSSTPTPTSTSSPPVPVRPSLMLLQVSTAVCAQVAGHKQVSMSREELSSQVVQKLVLSSSSSLLSSSSSSMTPQIVKIEHHGPSGQVMVDVQVDMAAVTQQKQQQQQESQPMDIDGAVIGVGVENVDMEDPLSAWYQATYHKPLPPNADRSITRTMIPAHESALDPRVHALYVIYQHQVHGDADPFVMPMEEEEKQEEMVVTMETSTQQQQQHPPNSTKDMDVSINKGNDDLNDDNEDHDNEEHENATNSMDIHEDEGVSEATATAHPITLLSQLDWGLAPSNWKERVRVMMEQYLEESIKSRIGFEKTKNKENLENNNNKDSENDQNKRRRAAQTALIQHYYGFYQFLVESPFPLIPSEDRTSHSSSSNSNSNKNQKKDGNAEANGDDDAAQRPPLLQHGTYHQHYTILDNILIAVGVIDVLPNGVSSVYLFYHPTLGRYLKGGVALGKYAIVREIEYTKSVVQLPYYYLGYYIESCQKMRYKADYRPSQLLCPTHYEWVDATGTAIPLLQKSAPRHICTLYHPPSPQAPAASSITTVKAVTSMDDDQKGGKPQQGGGAVPSKGGTSASTGTSSSTKKQKKTKNETNKDDILDQVQMDIGAANITVTIGMLQESGQDLVRPLLEEFVREAGPELAKQCILKLA